MVQLPAYGALALLVTGGLGVTIPDSTLCLYAGGAFKSNSRNTKQRPRSQNRSLLPPITTCNWEILGVSKMHSICSLFKAYLRMFSEDCTSQLYRCSITHKWTLFLCSNSLEIVCSSLADLQGPRTRIPCFVCKRSRTFSGMGNRVAKFAYNE